MINLETDLDALVEQLEALHRDPGFAAVARWKEQHPGAKAIGHLPVFAPRELIAAAGMLPVGVVGNGDLEIIRGDAYFQSYICHLPRSVIELGVSGRLDSLDGMVFPSTCDVIRNLSGMWKLLFPDKWVEYLDMPQNFSFEVGGLLYGNQLRRMRKELGELAGREITDDALRAAIVAYDDNRRLMESLHSARRDAPWKYPSWEVYLVMRAGYVLPVEEHDAVLNRYLELASERDAVPRDHIRVVLSGAFCEQPPLDMIRTLERAGCYIVEDDLSLCQRWHTAAIFQPDADPIDAMVHGFLTMSRVSASVYRPDGDNGQDLVNKVLATGAEGVVFAAPSFCDPALLDQPMNVAALDSVNIPYTSFKYSENTGQFQVIREQAGTFSDSIRLWGQA